VSRVLNVIKHKGKDYELSKTPKKYKLKDISDNEIKIHLNFSKDPKDHAEARHGWELFWNEILANE